jgi:hypothetical protein
MSLTNYDGGRGLSRWQRDVLNRDEFEKIRDERRVKDDVELAALMGDGALAVAARFKRGLKALDEERESLARNDLQHEILGEIEDEARLQLKVIQRNMYGLRRRR